MKKILDHLDQWVDPTGTGKLTLYSRYLNEKGQKVIKGEPITIEQAAQWVASNQF